MSETSPQKFAVAPDRIDGFVVDIIREVHEAATGLGIRYFLVGATAREIILRGVFGLASGRGSADVDFGIASKDWAEFERLQAALVATGRFEKSDRIQQRAYYRLGEGHRVIVDLIPFGGVEEPNGTLAWPPDKDIVLNVAGFADGLASAVTVEITDGLCVPVASVAGLAILKLLAWASRRNETNQDAADLFKILKDYASAGNEERLYGVEQAMLEAANFDVDIAGAQLLGADVARLATSHAADGISRLLDSDSDVEALMAHVVQSASSIDAGRSSAFVSAFRAGFLAKKKPG